MGMTANQLALVRSVAENKLQDAKKYAIMCCAEDTTQKNASYVKRYSNMLQNSNATMIEMPFNIKGMAQMEDVSGFRIDRYYLSPREEELFNKLKRMNEAGLRLMEMGIPYLNAVLLTGPSGTGKTTFGRYAAHELGLPFLYINFSYLVDSLMGNTSKNIRNVFDFARISKCLLMLDEIDCIAQTRKGNSSGADKELSNTTVSLLQELDQIQNDSIIIGATNIPDTIDPAVVRRFSLRHEVQPLMEDEAYKMVHQYLDSVGIAYDAAEAKNAVHKIYQIDERVTQAEIQTFMVQKIADTVIEQRDRIIF